MSLEVTGVQAGEVDDYLRAFELPFGGTVHQIDIDYWASVTEHDRALAVRDSGRIVATAANLSMDVSVPGGTVLPMAGVTAVAVWPSHRRRGLASTLLDRLHRDARERGEPVAGLWASESAIYGRFGYGNAVTMADRELSTAHAAFLRPVDPRGAVRLIEPDEAVALVLDLYGHERGRTPGMPALSETRLRGGLTRDPEHWRGGASARLLAAVDERGFVAYRVKPRWVDGVAASEARVESLYARDPETWALLWRYLCDLDLVSKVVAHGRPLDEPLQHLLADPRRAVTAVRDALWLRVLDVPAVLAGRAPACDGAVTIEVVDEAGFATGRWRLETGEGKAECTATTAGPGVTLPVDSLGAACLGGTRLTALGRAGRADEHAAGSLRLLDRMLASDPLPWCPIEF